MGNGATSAVSCIPRTRRKLRKELPTFTSQASACEAELDGGSRPETTSDVQSTVKKCYGSLLKVSDSHDPARKNFVKLVVELRVCTVTFDVFVRRIMFPERFTTN